MHKYVYDFFQNYVSQVVKFLYELLNIFIFEYIYSTIHLLPFSIPNFIYPQFQSFLDWNAIYNCNSHCPHSFSLFSLVFPHMSFLTFFMYIFLHKINQSILNWYIFKISILIIAEINLSSDLFQHFYASTYFK